MHLGDGAGEPEAHAAWAGVEAGAQGRHLRALTSQRVAEGAVGDEAVPPCMHAYMKELKSKEITTNIHRIIKSRVHTGLAYQTLQ